MDKLNNSQNKLDRFFSLLGAGTNALTRKAAAEQIGIIAHNQPHHLSQLLQKTYQCLIDKDWDTRNAAGKTLEAIASNISQWNPLEVGEPHESMEPFIPLSKFDIDLVLLQCSTLLGSGGQEYDDNGFDGMTLEQRIASQKKILNEKLGLQYLDITIFDDNDLVSGFNSKKSTPVKKEVQENKPIVKDELTLKIEECEKLINDPTSSSRVLNTAKRKLKDLKAQRESRPLPMNLPMKSQVATKQMITEQPQDSSKIVIESVIDPLKAFEDNIDWPFQIISTTLMNDLFSPKWETRHGAAIGLRSILKKQGSGAGKKNACHTE